MPVFRKDSKKILFVHIPKTGGSSIEAMMKRSGWECGFHRVQPPGFLKITPQHYHGELLQTIFDINKFDFCFSVVRDPVSRFISEYKYRNKHKYNSQLTTQIDINKWAKGVFKKYQKNKSIFDNHLRPQSEFVFPECYIIPFERLADTHQILCDITQEKLVSLPHLKKFTFDEKIELNEETNSMLRKIYHEDFNLWDSQEKT